MIGGILTKKTCKRHENENLSKVSEVGWDCMVVQCPCHLDCSLPLALSNIGNSMIVEHMYFTSTVAYKEDSVTNDDPMCVKLFGKEMSGAFCFF